MEIISTGAHPTTPEELKALEELVSEGMNQLLRMSVEAAIGVNPPMPIQIPGLRSLSIHVIISGDTAVGLTTVSGTTLMHRKPTEPVPEATPGEPVLEEKA